MGAESPDIKSGSRFEGDSEMRIDTAMRKRSIGRGQMNNSARDNTRTLE